MITKCWCRTCKPFNPQDLSSLRFVVCKKCGNKRCPHATDCLYVCTGSNEPGQAGSDYQ